MRWQELVNQLKTRPQNELLTPSQRAAYEALLPLLREADRVNLTGPAGSGKTFAAWAIARQEGVVYCTGAEMLGSISEASCVIIDNAPVRESEVRSILAECNLRGIGSVVVVTQRPTELHMRRVPLDLPSEDDWRVVRANMLNLRVLSPPYSATDLWEYLRLCSR